MIDPNLSKEITALHAEICFALSDPRRILMLYALNDRPRNVGEIALEIGISQPSTSRHLNLLRERGLVSSHREGQWVVYSLMDKRIIQALDLLRSVLAKKLTNQAILVEKVLKS